MSRCLASLLIIIPIFTLIFIGCSDQVDPIGDIDPDVPFPVTDLAISVQNDTTFLTWTATGDDGPNGTATRYDLRRHASPLTSENWSESIPVDGLPKPGPAGTHEKFVVATAGGTLPTMFFALKVIDDRGNTSKMSNVAFVDLTPPAGVTDLTALRVTDSYAHLSWTAPFDDGPLGHPDRYEIRVDAEMLTLENWMDSSPINGPSHPADAGEMLLFNLADLSPQSHYYAAVRSRDEANNLSEISNVIEITTPAAPLGWWDGFADLQLGDRVSKLHVHQDTLFVGGAFLAVEGIGSRSLASFDGTDWHDCGNGLAGGPYGSVVLDMTTYGNDLYVSGSFTNAGAIKSYNITRWTGSGFVTLGNPLNKGFASATEVFQNDLYVSWSWSPSSSAPLEFLDRWDGTSFHSLGWIGSSGPFITEMIPYQGGLLIVGDLKGVAGLTTESVILWDGDSYSPVGPELTGGRFNEPLPYAACEFNGDLYVAGNFGRAGDTPVNNIARWDGSSWHSLAEGVTGENVMVNDMVVYKGSLVVTGHFEAAGGRTANNIARWDGNYWEPFGNGLEGPDLNWVAGATLAVFQGSLYVGGTFSMVDGQPSPFIARWDLD